MHYIVHLIGCELHTCWLLGPPSNWNQSSIPCPLPYPGGQAGKQGFGIPWAGFGIPWAGFGIPWAGFGLPLGQARNSLPFWNVQQKSFMKIHAQINKIIVSLDKQFGPSNLKAQYYARASSTSMHTSMLPASRMSLYDVSCSHHNFIFPLFFNIIQTSSHYNFILQRFLVSSAFLLNASLEKKKR